MTITAATNNREDVDSENNFFIESSGDHIEKSIVVFNENNLTSPITGSYTTPAMQRIGSSVNRTAQAAKVVEDSDTGGVKIGPVTLFGDDVSISDFDSNRQGRSVETLNQFSRMNVPLVSINRERMLRRRGQINNIAAFNNYGVTKLFKSYDEINKSAIPYEDFPGRLDPAAYVSAGDYILQYMIVTDLTRNIDKFTNPDDLNGVIEVFEIRESFANTSISDIKVKGIKASMSNENFYSTGQGASPIENKFEIDQSRNSIFEDSQDVMYGGTTFSPKLGYVSSGSMAFEGFIPDEERIMSPFVESSSDRKISFSKRLRDFIGSEYTGDIATENDVPELGTRFRSSGAGFIKSPNYTIISSDRYINQGTDSIAFISTNRN